MMDGIPSGFATDPTVAKLTEVGAVPSGFVPPDAAPATQHTAEIAEVVQRAVAADDAAIASGFAQCQPMRASGFEDAEALPDDAPPVLAQAANMAEEVAESVLALTEEAADDEVLTPAPAAALAFTPPPVFTAQAPVAAAPLEAAVQDQDSNWTTVASSGQHSNWTTVWTVSNELPEREMPIQAAREKERRTLEQMMSLKPNDDERTIISKKVSWILRHGAKKVGLKIDDEGWVQLQDMLDLDIFEGIDEERLLSVVHESNAQKIRYELKDEEGGVAIKAMSKDIRNERMKQARESARERPDRNNDYRYTNGRSSNRGADERGDLQEDRSEYPTSRPERQNRFTRRVEAESGEHLRSNNGLTFEQQIHQGYRPVYQGGSVVAMTRNSETVKPGFKNQSAPSNGKERGPDEKGKGKGKRKGKTGADEEIGEAEDSGKGASRRWRVTPDLPVIVREGLSVRSDVVATLEPGTLVTQISEDKVLEKGIIRMRIEAVEPQAGVQGWVTRTAQSAGGPCYFRPERGHRTSAKGSRGKGFSEKGGYGWSAH